jgi:hypothetical protein
VTASSPPLLSILGLCSPESNPCSLLRGTVWSRVVNNGVGGLGVRVTALISTEFACVFSGVLGTRAGFHCGKLRWWQFGTTCTVAVGLSC